MVGYADASRTLMGQRILLKTAFGILNGSKTMI
jgi:hypothetical protein